MYSYRVEFQSRGSAHIHGVLWIDTDKLVDSDIKAGNDRIENLKSALETVRQDKVPNHDESSSIESYPHLETPAASSTYVSGRTLTVSLYLYGYSPD